jgi:serpin B
MWTIIVVCIVQAATTCVIVWLCMKLSTTSFVSPNNTTVSRRTTSDVENRASQPPVTPLPETERRILEALAKPFPVTPNGPEKMTLREACERLANFIPVPVDFDSKAIENASVDLGQEVEFPRGQRTVGGILDALLSGVGVASPLDWIVLNDSLTITTAEGAAAHPETMVYDVSDLAEPVVTPDGVEWSDPAALIDAIRAALPESVEEDQKLYGLNVNGRALLVVSRSRRWHEELAEVLVKIRSAPDAGLPPSRPRGRRRVVQKPRPASPPKIATEAELATIKELSVVPTAVSPAAVSSCNAFAFDLYRQLRKNESGNLTVCPFGLYSALCLLKEGASGEVEREIAHVLHAAQSADELRTSVRGLSNRLTAIHLLPGYELVVRNRAWCEESVPVPQVFTDALRDHYQAEVIGVPFFQRPNDAAKSINAWLTAATNGRINEIITTSQIAENRLDFAVTNAVLFSGRWADVFDPKNSAKAPFHLAGKTFDVMMMHRERETCLYGDVDGVQLLERPYRGGLLSAVVLLPRASAGALEGLETSLSVEKFKQWQQKMSSSRVNIELPRFEIQSDFRFEEPLKSLGMPRAFSPTADFSKLGRWDWKLTFVRQKALIKLNEEGTQAAAATLGGGMFGGPRNEPYLFRADRPFLILIQEKSTGLILFLARITAPERAS